MCFLAGSVDSASVLWFTGSALESGNSRTFSWTRFPIFIELTFSFLVPGLSIKGTTIFGIRQSPATSRTIICQTRGLLVHYLSKYLDILAGLDSSSWVKQEQELCSKAASTGTFGQQFNRKTLSSACPRWSPPNVYTFQWPWIVVVESAKQDQEFWQPVKGLPPRSLDHILYSSRATLPQLC